MAARSSLLIRLLASSSMVGALNKLPVAASGMIFFGDVVNFGSVTAVGTGFVAGLVYAIAKQNQAKVEKAKQAKLANNSYALREKA
jgi:GDP-mannose transporter